MRDHEERAREIVRSRGVGYSWDELRSIQAREIAAALRSAEESAARRCAEIAREHSVDMAAWARDPSHAPYAQIAFWAKADTALYLCDAIRSEFGLGEEAGDE